MMPGPQTIGEDAQAIPRVIHWVWLGTAPVPAIFAHYADSWRKHHPAWETRTWHDDTLPPLSCQAEYEQLTGFKMRYDIVRLEILRQFGGVIVDMDVEAIRPIDPLLPGIRGFIGRVGRNHVGNQVLGAVPHHPFFEEAVARLQAILGAPADRHRPASAGGSSSNTVGKTFLKQLLAERPAGMTVFPTETFHFQPSFEPPRRPDDFPEVYAVHHELASYASPPQAGDLEQAISNLMNAGVAPSDVRQLARLRKYELRLRRAVMRQARGYEALLRRVEAEREQAEARFRDTQRIAQQFAHRRIGVVAWARRLLTRMGAPS